MLGPCGRTSLCAAKLPAYDEELLAELTKTIRYGSRIGDLFVIEK